MISYPFSGSRLMVMGPHSHDKRPLVLRHATSQASQILLDELIHAAAPEPKTMTRKTPWRRNDALMPRKLAKVYGNPLKTH